MTQNGIAPSKKADLSSGRNLVSSKPAELEERKTITLLNSPLKTSFYFVCECIHQISELLSLIITYKHAALIILSSLLGLLYVRNLNDFHQQYFERSEKKILWWLWWILLGFLSSCGFGSGLHTFVLYLGPFIAQVTMSAYECRSLDFPEPPYPDDIICPANVTFIKQVSMFQVIRKVQIESILWGIGTAIGELPPYFMARAARLSGQRTVEELEVFADMSDSQSEPHEKLEPQASTTRTLSKYQQLELFLHRLVMRAGFLGILLCASIPNPLFDLAGITCGHFLIPFTTFFGATCIGKALIKVHIQQFAVIAVSSDNHIDTLVEHIGRIPYFGKHLQQPFLEYLQQQKEKLHEKVAEPRQTWIQAGIAVFVSLMMCLFIMSIVNALAQAYHRRLCEHRLAAENSASRKNK